MAAAAVVEAASTALRAPFKVGTKQILLPNFRVILKPTPSHLGPHYASFHVPLWFSKLDLRDYLYHVYSVRIGPSVRSYVKLSRLRQGANTLYPRPQYKRWHRPKSTKHMTVELERPFKFPEGPEDLKPWNKEEVRMATQEQKLFQESLAADRDQRGVGVGQRNAMREQAKALLEGREKWKPGVSRGGMMFSR